MYVCMYILKVIVVELISLVPRILLVFICLPTLTSSDGLALGEGGEITGSTFFYTGPEKYIL